MNATITYRSGAASDPGHQRTSNEDRLLADDANGVFLIVDGMGGHAAGELAADTAAQVIAGQMKHPAGDVERTIRTAITAANNRIYELAESQEECHGMACVLTLAVAHDDHFTVGHVGDSRLYLIWNGNLRKITSDHSLVGEKEDRGELTEAEAMAHPRRHEVLRDVGSRPRGPDESQFIEIKEFVFRPDAALLLCSDGLTDVLSSAQIKAIVEQYDGDAGHTARLLTRTASDSGGPDNISVVFIAGSEFVGNQSNTLIEARARHAATRVRDNRQASRKSALSRFLWLVTGMILGAFLWIAGERLLPPPSIPKDLISQRISSHIAVDPADPLGLTNALALARPGDTLDVPPGLYIGPLHLKDHVAILATAPGQAVLVSNPASPSDPGLALAARGVADARVTGLRIVGDEAHPLRVGALLSNASVEMDDIEVSGAIESGVRIDGASRSTLLADFIHANVGPGVIIADDSAPRLAGNRIADNGKLLGSLRTGIEISPGAKPVLENNIILGNGVAGIAGISPETDLEIRSRNIQDPKPPGFQKLGKGAVPGMK
jgi:serine/threonine protein phosphatase PrpC